ERSFAQFQADRDVVELAQQVQEEQSSLAGYKKAMERAHGSDKERWRRRYRRLKQQMDRKLRQVSRRTSTIARTFDRLTHALAELQYVVWRDETYVPTETGETLRRIYGERDLLVAECLRHNIWKDLSPVQLATLAAALVYEPRREDEGWEPRIPGEVLRRAFAATLDHWARLRSEERRVGKQGRESWG